MKKKVIVITGIGGMGIAIARRIGTGHKLVLADFAADKLELAANELRIAGYDLETQTLDISDERSVQELAQKSASLGDIRTIVHTAGLSPTTKDFNKILEVDLFGTALIITSFEQYLNDETVGVMIASMAGYNNLPINPELKKNIKALSINELRVYIKNLNISDPGQAYAIAKRANHFQVQSAAATWGRKGARIVSVSPGIISTPMAQKEMQVQPEMQNMMDNMPVKRIGTPEDIAAIVDFLQSTNASYITGTDILVDGGCTALTTN